MGVPAMGLPPQGQIQEMQGQLVWGWPLGLGELKLVIRLMLGGLFTVVAEDGIW